eukprot:gene12944-17241_t
MPAAVVVAEDGASGGQHWTRLYGRPRGFPQVIRSTKRFAGLTGLEEYLGAGFGIALRVRADATALHFDSDHYFLALGTRRLRLPRWIAPGALTISHIDRGGGAFDFVLVLRNRCGEGGMTILLWLALAAQSVMGAFDTIWHHEGSERLAWRPAQARELRLHGVRNLIYAALFGVLGWSEPHGLAACSLLALLAVELVITLLDFVEEDRTRHLPASERITHTLLTLNYGVVLAMLVPLLLGWAALPSVLAEVDHGVWRWLATLAGAAVALSGV